MADLTREDIEDLITDYGRERENAVTSMRHATPDLAAAVEPIMSALEAAEARALAAEVAAEGWPEATGAECARRRPSLTALVGLCRDHIARHPDTVAELAVRWPEAAVQS